MKRQYPYRVALCIMIEVLVYTCLYINIKWLLFFIPEMHIERASYKTEKAFKVVFLWVMACVAFLIHH